MNSGVIGVVVGLAIGFGAGFFLGVCIGLEDAERENDYGDDGNHKA